jgi:2-polyprenyl-6-methoxyphenol hydroxylase-like FAD-dependent oxidoreductase
MTDVLVVGAGPTGLMMACQLARHGVRFRIIDDQARRVRESRAFGIQALSMEIFDQLGLGADFAARVRRAEPVRGYVHGKELITLRFDQIGDDTRYGSLYLLAQPETEQIFLDDLHARGVAVERPARLQAFHQDRDGVTAEVEALPGGEVETIRCRYIIGCDGARSRVREVLGIPFEGATYHQEFVLADVRLADLEPSFRFFLGQRGLAVVAPVGGLTRVMGARFDAPPRSSDEPPTVGEVMDIVRAADAPIAFSRAEWLSRFRLHHRATRRYRDGRAFLAGDACHIHTPVGGQGMNTGLQDATNLAWKLAVVLRGGPDELLDTYEQERQRIGAILVQTTDRVFGLLTSRRPLVRVLRDLLAPHLLPLAFDSRRLRRRIQRFMSQLDIHYHANPFVRAIVAGADDAFRRGLHAGWRVPDLPLGDTTLHALLRAPAVHMLAVGACDEVGLRSLERRHAPAIQVHRIPRTPAARQVFERFGVTDTAVYVVRPDGYVGFRSYGPSLVDAAAYLDALFGMPRWEPDALRAPVTTIREAPGQ